MDELPTIVTVGIQNSSPERLIKLILENENPYDPVNEANTTPYTWEICNKYYSAKLQFRVFSFSDVTPSLIGNHVEAVIIFFDCILENFFDELNELNSCLKNVRPAIQTLVCGDGVLEDKNGAVEDWCINNKYELIELKSKIKTEKSEEDFEECFGIDRVREVLHAHQWPNLVMKDKSSSSVIDHCSELQGIESPENGNESVRRGPTNYAEDGFDLDGSLDDVEQLSTLFKDLQTMKRDISSLSGEDKLKQAERVVKTFWHAMHGDSDEFSESEDEL